MDLIPAQPINANSSACDVCSLSNLCLPVALNSGDKKRLGAAVKKAVFFNRGQRIFSQNAFFTSCYVVKSGAIKTAMTSKRGDTKILAFYLPGEMFGLDGISRGVYSCEALALERSSICEILFESLEKLAQELPHLQHYLFRLMSREISGAEDLRMLLSKNTAEERIISLVLMLSSRQARRKLSPFRFPLPMLRCDIANFLGLAAETVSRILGRLQKAGLVKINCRHVEILDLSALQRQLQQSGEFTDGGRTQLVPIPDVERICSSVF